MGYIPPEQKRGPAWNRLQARQEQINIALQKLDERVRILSHKVNPSPPTDREHAIQQAIALIKRSIHPDGKILNLYVWGSRYFGVPHCSSSDWDFLAIVEGYDQPEEGNVVEDNNIDVALYEVNAFVQKMNLHIPWVVQFLSHEPSEIIFQNFALSIDLRLPMLKKALGLNIKVNLRQAKGLWRDGDIRRSKKRVFYVLQIIDFMTQFVQHGKIYDKTRPNVYYDPIFSTQFDNWNAFESWFTPIHDKSLDVFKAAVNSHRNFETLYPKEPFLTRRYLHEFGMDSLHKNLSIKMTRHSSLSHLVHFMHIEGESPVESVIVGECNGVVLDEKNEWNIVSIPLPRYFSYNNSQAASIDWKDARAVELLDGLQVCLYSYQEKWYISTKETADGSEVINGETVSDRFWKIWSKCGYQLPTTTQLVFVFQLVSPHIQHVIYYPEESIVLEGVRSRDDLQQLDPSPFAEKFHWKLVKQLGSPKSLEHAKQLTEDLRCSGTGDFAGIVIIDKAYNRVKIESFIYQSLLQVKDAPDEPTQEFLINKLLALFAEMNPLTFQHYPFESSLAVFQNVKSEFDKLCSVLDAAYHKILKEKGTDPSEFVPAAHEYGDISSFLFFMRDGNYECSRHFFARETENRRKLNKYLLAWWQKHHHLKPHKIQFCFK